LTRIDPKKGIEKLNRYLEEIGDLENTSNKEGRKVREELDERIRSLVNIAFDDSKEKLSHYDTNPGFSLTTGMSEQEIDEAMDGYHYHKLELMKKHVIGFKEELELTLDTQGKTEELSEIEKKIKKVELESDRREEVAKSKFFGAVIELLDFQRNLLKDREETTKTVSGIKTQLSSIEDSLSQLVIQSSNSSLELEDEDIWYNEIKAKTEDAIRPQTKIARKDAKRHYSKIKMLKKELKELKQQYQKSISVPTRRRIFENMKPKKAELKDLMNRLADVWADYS